MSHPPRPPHAHIFKVALSVCAIFGALYDVQAKLSVVSFAEMNLADNSSVFCILSSLWSREEETEQAEEAEEEVEEQA